MNAPGLASIFRRAAAWLDAGPLAARIGDPSADSASLAEQLPYLWCGTYRGFGPVHLLADGSLGFAVGLALPCVDTVEDGEALASAVICQCLHSLPPGIQWQWFLGTRSLVPDALRRYDSQKGCDAVGTCFAQQFIARWDRAQHDGFFPADPEVNFFPRQAQLVLTIQSAPVLPPRLLPALLDALLPPTGRGASRDPVLDAMIQAPSAAKALVQCARDLQAVFHASGWEAQALGGPELIDWVVRILFPQRPCGSLTQGCVSLPVAGHHEIRQAIAAAGQIGQIVPEGFVSMSQGKPCHHRIVSMMWQPRSICAGLLNPMGMQRPNLVLVAGVGVRSANAALLQLKARALLNARSTHRFNATEMEARAQALHEVEHRLFAEGERLLDIRWHVHIQEPDADTADAAAESACKFLQSLDIEACVERDIGTALVFRGGLPFTSQPLAESRLRRRRRMLSRDAADLHPAGGSWTGVPAAESNTVGPSSPIVMYANPLGEPLFIDPTKAEKNPHALVIGQSGSGKSFFVHDYLLHLWRMPDVRLFLISIKADYRKLALLLGRYVDITLDADVCLNPFSGRPSRENQARWFAALGLMLSTDATGSLSREAEVLLQSACLAAAQKNWDASSDRAIRETTLEHVCLELERQPGQLGRQLCQHLHPYRRGPFSRLFNGERGIRSTDRFVFFNLGNILRQACAALASFCVFNLIDEVINDPSLRGVPKGLIADEVWALVRNPQAAAILERALKAYRSLGAFAMPIVQDPQDLDTPGGRVMLVNTATKIVLPLDAAGIHDIRKYLRLNDREFEIVRNLRLVKRRYSEFFVSLDGQRSAKGLLIPDPLRYAVSTTDPQDEARIEQMYQRHGDMFEALKAFSQASPYGLQPA